MTDIKEEALLRRVLYDLKGVMATVPGGGRLGPIDWVMVRGRRVGVRCATDAQWRGLCDLLTGRRPPEAGRLEERNIITVQTDRNLWETLDLNQSISDYLNSTDAPAYVWLEKRRRSLAVLLDRLGIDPGMTRRPVKLEDQSLQHKFWALRFMVSRAELLMGREVLAIEDDAVQNVLKMRWNDFPGTLIVCRNNRPLPGQTDTEIVVGREGEVILSGKGTKGEA